MPAFSQLLQILAKDIFPLIWNVSVPLANGVSRGLSLLQILSSLGFGNLLHIFVISTFCALHDYTVYQKMLTFFILL